ncbi:hypothetical protein [Peribacillus sp. RS7]|jgi:hypothetical protein|uniref:hypothetical protein n=1 Tax=Peribacillus sp. RS7 TaxID=3242679 RepID=UPI0035C1FE46
MNVLADFFFEKSVVVWFQKQLGRYMEWRDHWHGILSIEAVILDASFVDKTVNFQYPDNAGSAFNSIRYYKKIK